MFCRRPRFFLTIQYFSPANNSVCKVVFSSVHLKKRLEPRSESVCWSLELPKNSYHKARRDSLPLLFHLPVWTDGPEVCWAPLVFSTVLMEVTGGPFSSFLGTRSMSVINYRLCDHYGSETKTQVQWSCFGSQTENRNFFLQSVLSVGRAGGTVAQHWTFLFTNQDDLLNVAWC